MRRSLRKRSLVFYAIWKSDGGVDAGSYVEHDGEAAENMQHHARGIAGGSKEGERGDDGEDEGLDDVYFYWAHDDDGEPGRKKEKAKEIIGLARGLQSFAGTEFGAAHIQVVKTAKSTWFYQTPEPGFCVFASIAGKAGPSPEKSTRTKNDVEGETDRAVVAGQRPPDQDQILRASLDLIYQDFRLRFGSFRDVLDFQGEDQYQTYLSRFMPKALRQWSCEENVSLAISSDFARVSLSKATLAQIADLVKQLAFQPGTLGSQDDLAIQPDQLMSLLLLMDVEHQVIRTPNEHIVAPRDIPVIVRLLKSVYAPAEVAIGSKAEEVGPSSVLSRAALTNFPWDLGMRSLWGKSSQAWYGKAGAGASSNETKVPGKEAENLSTANNVVIEASKDVKIEAPLSTPTGNSTDSTAYAIPIHLEEKYIMSTVQEAGLIVAMFHPAGDVLAMSENTRNWMVKRVAPWLHQVAALLQASASTSKKSESHSY